LPPSISTLEQRLRSRAQDSDQTVAARMAKAESEISHWAEYDYVLVNDDLDQTLETMQAIVRAERFKRERRPGMSDFVRSLMEERSKS